MRLFLPFLAVLAACDEVQIIPPPEAEHIDTEICFVGESNASTTNALGEACEAPTDSLSYSMLGPNVMLLVDKSGSMQGDKWAALQSLTPYLPAVGARSNLGLSIFPGPNNADDCAVTNNEMVPVAEGDLAAGLVSEMLISINPDGSTPMGAALDKLVDNPGLSCTNRDNIVVLLSDGAESCDGDPVRAAEKLATSEVPVELFVIGFATDADDNRHLQEIASAAAPSTGPDNFYTAATVEELLTRLYTVTATCTAQLDSAVSAEELIVSLDGQNVQHCTDERCESGYTYDQDHATIRLEGSDCLALQDGQCHDLGFTLASN